MFCRSLLLALLACLALPVVSADAKVPVTHHAVKPGNRGPQGARGPKGSRGSRGMMGPVGATGAKGDAGATGPAGPKGDTGPAGPLLDVLPSGRTERGVYGIDTLNTGAVAAYGLVSVSFPISLAAPPVGVVVRVGSVAVPHCTGTAALPTADPGFFCAYESASSSPAPSLSLYQVTPYGTTSFFAAGSATAGAEAYSVGTWAVTAP